MAEAQDPDIDSAPEEEICLCCQKVFTKRNGCVQCFLCELWAHVKCSGLSSECMKALGSKKNDGIAWTCRACKSFATKYSKINLKIDARLDKLEEQIDKVEELQEEVKKLNKKVELIESFSKTNDNDSFMDELRERDYRKENILLYDLPEPTASTGEQRARMDLNRLKDILDQLKIRIEDDDVKFMIRVGRFDNTKMRPALVGIPNSNLREKILSKAPQLNNMRPPFNAIKIAKDLTRRQREDDKNIRLEAVKLNDSLSEEEKKNVVWKVVGKKGERRLIKGRVTEAVQRHETEQSRHQGDIQNQPRGQSQRYEAQGCRPRLNNREGEDWGRDRRQGAAQAHHQGDTPRDWEREDFPQHWEKPERRTSFRGIGRGSRRF